jgi:DNA-binding NtrC family response regulator
VQRAKVLVLADDPLIAALLGMLLELAGFEPAFAAAGEEAEHALDRHRSTPVILVDGGMSVARSDLFFARAARSRTRVILFGRGDGAGEARDVARARGIPWLAMPTDGASLARLLDAAPTVEN